MECSKNASPCPTEPFSEDLTQNWADLHLLLLSNMVDQLQSFVDIGRFNRVLGPSFALWDHNKSICRWLIACEAQHRWATPSDASVESASEHDHPARLSQKFLTVVNDEGLARANASANANVVFGAHESRSLTMRMGSRQNLALANSTWPTDAHKLLHSSAKQKARLDCLNITWERRESRKRWLSGARKDLAQCASFLLSWLPVVRKNCHESEPKID